MHLQDTGVVHSKAPPEMKFPVYDTTHKSSFAGGEGSERKPPPGIVTKIIFFVKSRAGL